MTSARSKLTNDLFDCCPAILEGPLDEEIAETAAALFAALADPVRLRILGLIASSPSGELCACDLVIPSGRSQPTVSHHLKILHEAGLVDREKRATWVFYRVRWEQIEAVRTALASTQTDHQPAP